MTNEQLKSIYFGALWFDETKDGYLQAFQFSQPQMDYFEKADTFWFERSSASTSKTLEFTTRAEHFSFEYKIIWEGSPDSVELYVDGLCTDIRYIKDLPKNGSLSFEMPQGEKSVVFYLPADATMLIKDFEIDGDVTPAEKKGKLLWLGDSITQGFGPLRTSETYVSIVNRTLNYEVLNLGIGAYKYDANSLMKMGDYMPDAIIVALGTNQYGDEDMSIIEDYYVRLREIYPETIPVLCISPVWRGDNREGIPVLMAFCEKVKQIASACPNTVIIDGMKLVPHLSDYYLDDLHPNILGCETYGANLLREMEKIGFLK
ncbi:MAG: hypothetical protein K6E84_06435 [Lachnospiraceae bacterium]|nr:hypothetical protein [Lachnospiraceae bacterium]